MLYQEPLGELTLFLIRLSLLVSEAALLFLLQHLHLRAFGTLTTEFAQNVLFWDNLGEADLVLW